MNEWISVNEMLPNDRDFVLVKAVSNSVGLNGRFIGRLILTYNNGETHISPYWNNSFYGDTRVEMRHVTHWMPLPEAPHA